jgi:hypothetical protein
VSFDSRTNKIVIQKDGDFLADSGSLFLKVFNDIASSKADLPEGVVRDWKTIEAWLGCAERELTSTDYQTFGVVFRSYLAHGIAPSLRLESAFKAYAEMGKKEAWVTVAVPPELRGVFDRMLASDMQIQERQARNALQFAAALRSLDVPQSRLSQSSAHTPSMVRLNWIPMVASIVMLIMASAGDWPYGFYQLLRIVVFGSAIFVVVHTMNHRPYWPWVMSGIAILFNPILPISFTQEDWQPIDFSVAVVFVVALIQLRQSR